MHAWSDDDARRTAHDGSAVPTHARRTASMRAAVAAIALGACAGVVTSVLTEPSAQAAHVVPAVDPPPVGAPPDAVITLPDRVYAGIPFTVRGDRSSAGALEISEWEWDLDDDGEFEQTSTSTPWASTTLPRGRSTVRLRVRSQNGLVASTSSEVRAVAPPAGANLAPLAPAAVQADADGTTIEVSWSAPAFRSPVTYRVANLDDPGTDPQFVLPADGLSASFPDLAPGTYRMSVAGVGTEGAGPELTAEAVVRARGEDRPAPSPTPTVTPTPTEPAPGAGPEGDVTPEPTAVTDTATATTGSDRRTGALVLVATGAALIAVAVVGAILGMRRRRDVEADPSTPGTTASGTSTTPGTNAP